MRLVMKPCLSSPKHVVTVQIYEVSMKSISTDYLFGGYT